MKTLLIAAALVSASFVNAIAATSPTLSGGAPADSSTHKLTVTFSNVTKRTGMIYVGVVKDAADFEGISYRKTRVAVPASGEFQVSFDALPAGQYAVKVFQDLNENMKLDITDKTPTEPFGFSNVKMLMGPPSFAQSAFDLNAPKTVTINLLGL